MIFLSPGVKTEEKDMSQYAATQSTCIVGMVGAAKKGVIGEATLITSIPELLDIFGLDMLDDYAIQAAAEFLKKGNQLYYTRLAESFAKKASAELMNGALLIKAKTEGTFGNTIGVAIKGSDGTKATLETYLGETLKETFIFSFDSKDENFVENISSEFVDLEFVEEVTALPQIIYFEDGFKRSERSTYCITDKDDIRQLSDITFETMVDHTVSSVTVDSDSFGILAKGEPAALWKSDGPLTTLTLKEEAQVKIPQTTISNLKLSLVTKLADDTEATYNAAFSEKFIEVLPYSEGNRGPAEGNPWLVADFDASNPSTQINFSVYKKDTKIPLILEMQTAEGPSSRRIFRNGGANFQSFEVLKSRTTADTLNFASDKGEGIYIFRVEVEEKGKVVQILEEEFELRLSDIDFAIKKAEPVLGVPTLKNYPSQSTAEGLRVVAYNAKILSPLNKELDVKIIVKPDGENILEYVDTDVPEYSIPQISNAAKLSLEGGNDGAPLRPETVSMGLEVYRSPDTIDINLLAAPGFSQDIVVNKILEIAGSRGDCVAIVDTPQGLTYQQAIKWHNGLLEGEFYPEKPLDTSYGALYWPWVKVSSVTTGTPVWAPPSGVVLAKIAYNDSIGQPWFAPAGLNRGMLDSVLSLEKVPDEGQRDALYGNGNAINPLTNYKQQGLVIWGQRTLQRKPSALDRVNVRRLMCYVRKIVAASTAYLIFEQNDPLLWRQWLGIVEPVMDNIKNSRGLYDYKCVMDETTVTPFYQDRNEMPGIIFVKPTKTAEFIPISFVLKSTGASFEE